jgi:endonuclease YncB( thermonuclease family)
LRERPVAAPRAIDEIFDPLLSTRRKLHIQSVLAPEAAQQEQPMKILTAAIGIMTLGVGMWIAAGQSTLTRPLSSTSDLAGNAVVIDGDTIDVAGVRVRLEGIDAPEADQRCRDKEGRDYLCGISATNGLKALIGTAPVSCRRMGKDTYGRTLAVCSGENGIELNSELVQLGLAVAFRRYSDRYAAVEDAARAAREGLWAGSFEHPGCFRAARDGRPCRDTIPAS